MNSYTVQAAGVIRLLKYTLLGHRPYNSAACKIGLHLTLMRWVSEPNGGVSRRRLIHFLIADNCIVWTCESNDMAVNLESWTFLTNHDQWYSSVHSYLHDLFVEDAYAISTTTGRKITPIELEQYSSFDQRGLEMATGWEW